MRAAAAAALAVVLAASCHHGASAPRRSPAEQRLANLHAFARLYGVVRWFHPSDAAAATDWTRFATDGVRRVADAPDDRALRDRLRELFAPVAPTVQIAGAGETLAEVPAGEGELIYWQHLGYGDTVRRSVYASKRRHRARTVAAEGSAFASLAQAIDATPYRGAKVRLRGKLRADGGASAQLWLRVDLVDGMGFFDNMDGRGVHGAEWTDGEIVGTVAPDAATIVFGILHSTSGTAWFDDLELAVDSGSGWTPVPIADAGFEDGTNGWGGVSAVVGWDIAVDAERPAGGKGALRVRQATGEMTAELFDDAPAAGETVDVDLGGGLRARVPLTVNAPAGGPDREAAATDAPETFDALTGAADVVIVWNVLQHFWPYFDIVAVDWAAELDVALADALDDTTIDDHLDTMRRLSAAAPDGHAFVTCPGTAERQGLPVRFDWIEDQVVITSSADAALRAGDVLVSVDGIAAAELMATGEATYSGSPQWRRYLALSRLGDGAPGSQAAVVVRRGGETITANLARGDVVVPDELAHPPIDQLDGGVWYVDLAKASMPEIDAVMDQLAAAPGVVFDLRGYPNGTHDVLSHLLTSPDTSKAWMSVRHTVRPDRAGEPVWEDYGWEMQPLQPHIAGKVAFLTGPGAISYAESVMGLVEHYHLGEIVGAPTAGTNGNIASIAEPTGCSTVFTGMRVRKHDGTQHHLIGVLPTVPAGRTIAGVAAGRDEVLERALDLVR
jgi:C-terminal processing protease CtpA/Prc